MVVHSLKPQWRSSLASLVLASSLAGVMAACSSDTPTVTQVPATISAVPAGSTSLYYDGNVQSIKITDAAVIFAATQLKTSDTAKIIDFATNVLKVPLTADQVNKLGDPLSVKISDFTGDGTVDVKDAAVLFAIANVGTDATKVNNFVTSVLKLSGITVTQGNLDSFFKPTPTPSPTSTPTPTPTPTPDLVVNPTSLTIPSGSTKTLNVALPQAPTGNVTVTVTPSTGITVSPTSLNFTPTSFSGTVIVGSTAAPGTTGTVTLSAPGFANKVVNVTVGQSAAILVTPDSLEIPTGGSSLKTFNVKLAAAPATFETITITTPPGFTADKSSLTFTSSTFNVNQTVTVTTTAAPGTEEVIKLTNPTLGRFDVKVKAVAAVGGQFFVDPVNGSNANPGTAAQPFQTLEYALGTSTAVVGAANTIGTGTDGGTDVTVTIIGGGTETLTANLAPTALTRGSITVVGNSSFTLKLANNSLTLNKGYKLTNFVINNDGAMSGPQDAVILAGVNTSLRNMTVDCSLKNFASTPGSCVKVTAPNTTITLDNVTVRVKGSQNDTYGIKHDGNSTTLEVLNSAVISTGSGGTDVKGIYASGTGSKLVVQSTTVNLSTINSGTNAKPTIGVYLNTGGSEVRNSIIRINGTLADDQGAIGVDASAATSPPKSSVTGNTFETSTNTVGIGIRGQANLDPNPSPPVNTFPVSPANLLKNNIQ